MTETNNLAPPCAVNQTLPQVLGRFSNLPHAAPGLKLKSAKLLLQKSTKEAPIIIYTDWSLLLQNKHLEPIVTVSDYHTSYVTRHNHQVGFLAACNLEQEKVFSPFVHVFSEPRHNSKRTDSNFERNKRTTWLAMF